MKFKIKGDTREDTIENISFVILFVAAVFTVLGISVGTFVLGFPTAIALVGAFLVVVGLALYIFGELLRILSPSKKSPKVDGQ